MPVYSLYSFHRTFIPGFEYLTPSGFISSFEYLTHCGPVSCGHVSLHIIIIIYFLRHFFSCHCYIIYKRFTSNFIGRVPTRLMEPPYVNSETTFPYKKRTFDFSKALIYQHSYLIYYLLKA